MEGTRMGTITTQQRASSDDLDRRVLAYHEPVWQPATRYYYQLAWQHFENFCASRDAWKATPRDVARWCVSMADGGLSFSTITCRMSALRFYFEQLGKGHLHGHTGVATRKSPSTSDLVRRTILGIRRRNGAIGPCAEPLMLDSVEKMIDVQPDNLFGLRNRALLSLAWASARRANEVVALNVEANKGNAWIEWDSEGLVVVLRKSKTNQSFERVERYGVPARRSAPRYCPVVLLRKWLAESGIREGHIFRGMHWRSRKLNDSGIHIHTMLMVVKKAAADIGLNTDLISTHSLRVGCITWLYLEGVHPERIREHSGHQDLESLLKYIRLRRTAANSPLAETRWVR